MRDSQRNCDDSQIRHCVLTRFNLASKGRERAFRSIPGWLERRFDLFETYCLPSLAAQQIQEFDWIVLFDEMTPEWAKERVQRAQGVRYFHAVFMSPSAAPWGKAVRHVVPVDIPSGLLCTTNLDSDDALASDYIYRLNQAIRCNLEQAMPFAINFKNGYVYHNGRLYSHVHRSSAFTNIVERNDTQIKTCNAFRHMRLRKHMPIIQEENGAAWVQVVHGSNVSNKVRGKLCRKSNLETFPIKFEFGIETPTYTEFLLDTRVVFPFRVARDILGRVRNLHRYYV